MLEANQKINPLVSVVIPCFNDFEFIEQSLNSVWCQTYKNIEVILVDDGSNTKTKEVLKKLESKISKLITQENKGQSSARNVGIKAANGDYIVTLDSDDFFEPSFCEKAIDIIENNNQVKIVSCHIVRFNKKGIIDIYNHYCPGDIKILCFNNQATGSVLFRKEDFSAIGGYDETMRNGFEDWEFYIRLLKNGGELKVIEEPLLNYRIRENSTTSRANKVKYELLNYIYLKHQDLYRQNFELFVNHIIKRLKQEEKDKIKNTKRLEFRIGKVILRPLRFLKSLLK